MADEPKTDGTGTATGATTQVEKPATNGSGEKTPEHVPYDRFQGVVAERGRWETKAKEAEAKLKELSELHKTEDQKRIDAAVKAVVDAEWKPKADYWQKREADDKAELDALVSRIPEDHRGAIAAAPDTYSQLRIAKTLVTILEKKGSALTTAATPAAERPASSYTREQWDAFAALARTDPKKYNEMKPEMFKAANEGRVAGLRQAV